MLESLTSQALKATKLISVPEAKQTREGMDVELRAQPVESVTKRYGRVARGSVARSALPAVTPFASYAREPPNAQEGCFDLDLGRLEHNGSAVQAARKLCSRSGEYRAHVSSLTCVPG